MSSVRVFVEWFGIVRVIHFRSNSLQQVNNPKTKETDHVDQARSNRNAFWF